MITTTTHNYLVATALLGALASPPKPRRGVAVLACLLLLGLTHIGVLGATVVMLVLVIKLVSAADIDFTGLTPKAYHGMPIGTGEMGSLVWNSGSSALKFQINRTDVFGCNSAVTAVSGDVPNDEDVTKVVSDFGYGCGFLTVDFGGPPFGPATKHHLSLYDGKLAIAGEGVSAEIIAGVDADALLMRIKVRDHRQPLSSGMLL